MFLSSCDIIVQVLSFILKSSLTEDNKIEHKKYKSR